MTSEIHPPLIDELERERVRVVFHNLGTVGEHMSNILVDYTVGIEEAVQHLISLGHRKVVHIAGPSHFRSALIRREAFLSSMERHLPGGPTPEIYDGDFKFEGGRRAAHEILNAKSLPTAVIVSNDMMALGAMQEFRAAGVIVPRDISVVGFDDITFAAFSEPPLTTICSPRTEIGRRAIEALMMTIERPSQTGMEIRIPTYLVTRSSTAPPPKPKRARPRS
jgi:DNA-binding LacI/PurR family transcriptional regulator